MSEEEERDDRSADAEESALSELDSRFPVKVDIPVAWGEMDSMGHVNNIVYFRYFESARIAYFEEVGFLSEMRATGVGPILASTRCDFRKPLFYPDRVVVGASAGGFEENAFTMLYRVVSRSRDRVVAEGEGRIVSYDYRAKKKAPLPASLRSRIEALEAR